MKQGRKYGVASAAPTSSPSGPVSQAEEPAPQLGANFEHPASAPLGFSTKARVWGDDLGATLDPAAADGWSQPRRTALRNELHHRCMFCGLESQTAEVHNRNDNHRDLRPENLGLADPICHRWQHLGELGKGNAMLVYLPGLSPSDASHLLRTTLAALQARRQATRSEGRKVLNWMASHHIYVDEAWGSSDPAAFASALARSVAEDRDRKGLALCGLALVIHPDTLRDDAALWAQELGARHDEARWPDFHHGVINAPT
jgi:intracellular multiplication protein IcmJ